MQSYKKTTLKNGLRIITVPNPEALATTFLVLVEAGSKYETKDINGLSHFLEHLCFKGTSKRPLTADIATELDALGAEYNAFTSQEYTGYYAKVESHKLDKALEIVTDLYLDPIFDPKELETEKGVIIEELNMYEDLPMRKVHEHFMELLHGDQPAGWDVGGKKEIIRGLTREQIINYRGQHYVAGATLIVVAGAFDEQALLKKIEQGFAQMSTATKASKIAVIEKQNEPMLKTHFKEVEQTHLVIGCRAFPVSDERQYPLEVLADILGGGMSSRLFQKVRDQLGAAYYVRAETEFFTDHGHCAVAAGVDHNKLEIVIAAIVEELKKLTETPVGEKELQKAKSHLTGKLILGLESSDALASFYGGQEILGQPVITPQQLIKKIELITSAAIQSVAQDIIRNDRLNCALIGPVKDGTSIEKLLRLS